MQLAMFPSFPAQFLCMQGEGLRMYILQCMRHAVCSESEILFKCRGQYIGGCKLLNRRNTLDIKRSDIHCYHGTKNDGGLLVRRMPVQQQDGVIDYHLFKCIPCLSWKQLSCTKARPTAAETTNIYFAKQQPSPHKPQARDSMTCEKACKAFIYSG